MVTFPKSPWVRHLRVYLNEGRRRRLGLDQRLGLLIKKQDNTSFLPLLCEINIFLWQDGEDLVQDLVWVGLTGQSNVVLCLAEKKTGTEMLCTICCAGRRTGNEVCGFCIP